MRVMERTDPLTAAIRAVGLTVLSRELGVSHQAVQKWRKARRMPRTEWTGETTYWQTIQTLTGNEVTREQLLAKWPDAPVDAGAPPQGLTYAA